jgi:5-hydroxyisourate hydrolase-like protein (transthyretin family)
MPNRLLWIAAAILLQARAVPPPLPVTPAPANAGPQGIFTGPGNFVLPPGLDQPGQQLPPGTATIDGIVTVAGTSDPIAGAAVEIRKTDCGKTGGESMTATSGPDGKFSFKQVRAGNWCVGAAKSGGAFSPVEYQQRGYKSRGLAIPIADNQQVQDIKLMMPRTGSISGRVFDSDGQPMGHARVQAMEAFYESGQRRLYTLNAVQTNDLGEFSIFWLPPGEYFVSAVPEDPQRQNVTFSVSPPGIGGHRSDAMPPVISRKNLPDGTFSEEVYAPVYFGGGPDPQRAQKITVAPGSSNSVELSFAGARTGSFHVRGRAINGTTGQPAESAQIRLYPQRWTATAVVPFARVDKNGNFDIAGVAPGSYALYASSSTRDPNATNPTTIQGLSPDQLQQLLNQGVNLGGTIPIGARIPVEMGNQNIEGISVNLLAGGILNGEFIFEGNLASTLTPQQKSSFRVNLSRQPDIPGATLGGASTGAIAPNATDNSFRMPSIFPGDFRVMVSPLINAFSWAPPTLPDPLTNMYVKSARYGNQDALSGGLHLDTHNPDQRLQITLATGGALQGVVLSTRNEPMSNVKVALIPNSGNPDREDLYRNAVTDASGRFKIQGIAGGDYRVFAWEDVADGAWEDPEVLRDADARGKTVHINEGEQSSVEVFANPGGRQ